MSHIYINEADRLFHETTGIRLPDPRFDHAAHRVYDRLAYEIAFGYSKPDDWALGDDPQSFLQNVGGVLAIPHGLAKVF